MPLPETSSLTRLQQSLEMKRCLAGRCKGVLCQCLKLQIAVGGGATGSQGADLLISEPDRADINTRVGRAVPPEAVQVTGIKGKTEKKLDQMRSPGILGYCLLQSTAVQSHTTGLFMILISMLQCISCDFFLLRSSFIKMGGGWARHA